MDKHQDFIERPTLSFPAYTETKRPRWLFMLGGIVIIVGMLLMILAVMNFGV